MTKEEKVRSGLFLGNSCQKGSPQPVRLRLARSANSRRNTLRFIGTQTNRKDFAKGVFFQQSRASHFLCHNKSLSVYKKYLTRLLFSYTKSQASNFGAVPFQQSARTSLEGLAHQRHPVTAGAGSERLAIMAQAKQAADGGRHCRSLKIEATGDYFKRKIIPKIRLTGHWLEHAGFKPGHRVEVVIEQAGTLSLRFLEQGKAGVL